MIADISKVRGIDGASCSIDLVFEYTKDIQMFSGLVTLAKPVTLSGSLSYTNGFYIFDGMASTTLKQSCGRCLCDVLTNVTFPMTEQFMVPSNAADIEFYQKLCEEVGSNTVYYDNEEVWAFMGNTIDFFQPFVTNLLLCIDMQVLCKEDCEGICPLCGQNLNESHCNCDRTFRNDAFDSLKSLFD